MPFFPENKLRFHPYLTPTSFPALSPPLPSCWFLSLYLWSTLENSLLSAPCNLSSPSGYSLSQPSKLDPLEIDFFIVWQHWSLVGWMHRKLDKPFENIMWDHYFTTEHFIRHWNLPERYKIQHFRDCLVKDITICNSGKIFVEAAVKFYLHKMIWNSKQTIYLNWFIFIHLIKIKFLKALLPLISSSR